MEASSEAASSVEDTKSTRIARVHPRLLQETYLFADKSATGSACAKKEVKRLIVDKLRLADLVEADLNMLTATNELPEVRVFVAGLEGQPIDEVEDPYLRCIWWIAESSQ